MGRRVSHDTTRGGGRGPGVREARWARRQAQRSQPAGSRQQAPLRASDGRESKREIGTARSTAWSSAQGTARTARTAGQSGTARAPASPTARTATAGRRDQQDNASTTTATTKATAARSAIPSEIPDDRAGRVVQREMGSGTTGDVTHRAAKSWQRRLKNNPSTLYRDPAIDGNTLVAVSLGGGVADRRPVMDSQGRYFGRGPEGRRRQIAHAQEVMSGEPVSARPPPPPVPMTIPRTPLLVGAPYGSSSSATYPALANHPPFEYKGGVLIPAAKGVAESRLRRRRPSAELRALDALYETKARGGRPRLFHHHPRPVTSSAARMLEYEPDHQYNLGHGPGYLSGRPGLKEEAMWETTTVPRKSTGASVARIRSEDGIGVRHYTAAYPAVRRTGGGSNPEWERSRQPSHRLHPDAVELMKLQAGWQEGWRHGPQARRQTTRPTHPYLSQSVASLETRATGEG